MKDMRIMAEKTKRILTEQCNMKQQIIDKKKVVSDFEKSKLAQQDITYDTRIVEANLKLADKIKERDQLVEQLEKRRAFLKTVKEQTSTN